MGENFRSDLVFVSPDNKIYILELTVGFETNVEVNDERNRAKYQSPMETLKSKYTDVKFVNLSISSLGIFSLSGCSFIEMCDALAVDMGHRRYLISKLSNTIIRTNYYIFSRRNKPWNPGGGGVTSIYTGTGRAIFWGAFFQAGNKFWGIIFGKIIGGHKFWGIIFSITNYGPIIRYLFPT